MTKSDAQLRDIVSKFRIMSPVESIAPLGSGLINDTFRVRTSDAATPDYVLQRINTAVFQDVETLQRNIEMVTNHLRSKMARQSATDLDRRVLRLLPAHDGKTYHRDADGECWRMTVFIANTRTLDSVTPDLSECAGLAFGEFEAMLSDLPETLGETIPNFHNMELRRDQLREAVRQDPRGRVAEVGDLLDALERDMESMCLAERLHREGSLPKRACHCDTKINNMLFDEAGRVACVIDLDTVMPSFVFSDYGDFLRTAANSVAEDSADFGNVGFRMDIFEAFTRGYLSSTRGFLTPTERDMLPYAAALFPFMQCARFLTDYLNGDTYYKTEYAGHNLVRSRNQLLLYQDVRRHDEAMRQFIAQNSMGL